MIYDDLRDLVRDTRLFIQSLMPLPKTPPREIIPKQKRVEIPEKIDLLEIRDPLPPFPPPVLPRKIETKNSKGEWELHPMTQPEENLDWSKKLANYTQICVPEILAILLLPEENGVHRLFLENISRVLTKTYGPASVLKSEEKMWKKLRYKYIFAPCTLLKKKFPKAEPHISFKEGEVSWIPMENLDLYGHDVQAKRVLWTTIQHLFQS